MKLNFDLRKKLSAFVANSRRVLVIAKKPDWPEFKNMALVTGLGILIIAVIAFVIQLIFGLLGLL